MIMKVKEMDFFNENAYNILLDLKSKNLSKGENIEVLYSQESYQITSPKLISLEKHLNLIQNCK